MRTVVGSIRSFPGTKTFRKIAFRVLRALVIFFVAVVLTQDLQIIPAVFSRRPNFTAHQLEQMGGEQFFVRTKDGERIEVLRLAPEEAEASAGDHWAGILFHGNLGSNGFFLPQQDWLRKKGVTVYSFDYRGVGNSSGWPSESGIYNDSEAVWEYVRKREKIDSSRLILFGVSLGTGPALELAAKTDAAIVLLASPYTSLPEVVRADPLFWPFSPFVRYQFPSSTYIRQLNSTCLIDSHAEDDHIIPFEMSEALTASYRGKGGVYREFAKTGGHDVFWSQVKEIERDLKHCMEARLSQQS